MFMATREKERLTIARQKTSPPAGAQPGRDQHPCDRDARVLNSLAVNASAVPLLAGPLGRPREPRVKPGSQFAATRSRLFR
jgi:hypothetical protein